MQDCSRYDIMINERLDGTLNGKDAKELDKHLAECADCRKYLQLLETVKDGLREDLPEVPDSLREGIMFKIGLEKNRKRHFGAFGRWTAIAAVLCVVIFGVVKLNGSGVMGSSGAAAPKAAESALDSLHESAVRDYAVPEVAQEESLAAGSKYAVPSSLTGPTEAPAPAPAPAEGGGMENRDRDANGMPGAAANDADSGSVYMAASLPGYDLARAALDSGAYWGVCLFYDRLPEGVSALSWQTKIPEDGELSRWELSAEELQALENGAEWKEFYFGDLSADRGLVIVIAGEEE